jgi:hypothetical protein
MMPFTPSLIKPGAGLRDILSWLHDRRPFSGHLLDGLKRADHWRRLVRVDHLPGLSLPARALAARADALRAFGGECLRELGSRILAPVGRSRIRAFRVDDRSAFLHAKERLVSRMASTRTAARSTTSSAARSPKRSSKRRKGTRPPPRVPEDFFSPEAQAFLSDLLAQRAKSWKNDDMRPVYYYGRDSEPLWGEDARQRCSGTTLRIASRGVLCKCLCAWTWSADCAC